MPTSPWFTDLSAPYEFGKGGKVTVTAQPVGQLELRTGSVRVSTRHGLSRGSRPLDVTMEPGQYEVTRFIDASSEPAFPDGDLAVLLARPGNRISDLDWELATAGGVPAAAESVIGEADLALLLGTGPFADSFPMGYVKSRPATAEQRLAFESHARPSWTVGRLLPESEVEAYVGQNAVRLPWFYRPGFAPVWVGRDHEGLAVGLMADHLSAVLKGEALPRVSQLWEDPLEGGVPASLLRDAELVPEEADLTLIPGMSHVREVRLWHECNMTGRLFVVGAQQNWLVSAEELDIRERIAALPIEGAGWTRTYAVETADETMLFVRFAASRPTKWFTITVPDVRSAVLVSQSFLTSADEDVTLRHAFGDISEAGFTTLLDNTPAIATWRTMDGATPGLWVVGLDDSERVTALLISDSAEASVYPARSPALDLPFLDALRSAQPDAEDLEQFNEDMNMLEEDLAAAGGEVTPELRGHLHWLHQRYLQSNDDVEFGVDVDDFKPSDGTTDQDLAREDRPPF